MPGLARRRQAGFFPEGRTSTTMMRFDGRVIVVTGGSLGIGEATARAFAAQGGRVVVASRDPEHADAVIAAIRDGGGMAAHFATDVAKESDITEMVSATLDRFGRIDVLVNNAGIYAQGDVAATTSAEWQRIMDVNLTGAFLCTKHMVDALAETKGAVVIVSSEAGLVGIKGQVAYNVSKAGLIELTKSCAVDLAAHGIRVNCVCPGTTATPLVEAALKEAPDPMAARRALESVRPMNRLGTPEEIASAILYLASDEAGYATGAVLSVDGGSTAQ